MSTVNKMSRRQATVLALQLGALVCLCTSAACPDDDWQAEPRSEFNCIETRTELGVSSLLELFPGDDALRPISLPLSARLAEILGQHRLSATWSDLSEDSRFEITGLPPGAQTKLEVDIRRLDSEAIWVESRAVFSPAQSQFRSSGPQRVDLEPLCPSYVEVPVQLSMRSADGVLVSEFTDALRWYTESTGLMAVDIAAEQLKGTMQIHPAEASGTAQSSSLQILQTTALTSGVGEAGFDLVMLADPRFRRDQGISIASLRDAPGCPRSSLAGEHSVDLDNFVLANPAQTLDAAADALASLGSVKVDWTADVAAELDAQTPPPTDLKFTLATPNHAKACPVPHPEDAARVAYSFQVGVHVHAENAPIHAQLPAELLALVDHRSSRTAGGV